MLRFSCVLPRRILRGQTVALATCIVCRTRWGSSSENRAVLWTQRPASKTCRNLNRRSQTVPTAGDRYDLTSAWCENDGLVCIACPGAQRATQA